MRKLTAEERAAKRAQLQEQTEAIIKASEEKPKRKKSAAADEVKTEDKNDDVKEVQESSTVESSDVAPVEAAGPESAAEPESSAE
jgi:hypothetical protein